MRWMSNFYPRPPRGGRRLLICTADLGGHISIHALREEGDHRNKCCYRYSIIFLSTPSARRATDPRVLLQRARAISIHALREEGDVIDGNNAVSYEISIHALREEGDRPRKPSRLKERGISIHALREEGDVIDKAKSSLVGHFYPRPPRGGRLAGALNLVAHDLISIHALREEGDSKNRDKISIFKQIIQHSARI